MGETRELFDVGPRQSMPAHPCTPATIGSGPVGETCRSCRHAVRNYARYYKCALMKKAWSHGAATDIKLRWPACLAWAAKDKPS